MKNILTLVLCFFSFMVLAKNVLLPSSIYLDGNVVDAKILEVIESINIVSKECEKPNLSSKENCESSKIQVNDQIKTLHAKNCSESIQGNTKASRDCVEYINNRLINGSNTKKYLRTVKYLIPKKADTIKFLNFPKQKVETTSKDTFEKLGRSKSSGESIRRDYVRGKFKLKTGQPEVAYIAPNSIQGQKYIADFWNPVMKINEYNQQDAAFIHLFRTHLKKQNEAYLDWCIKRSEVVSLKSDYSLSGISRIISSCQSKLQKETTICDKYEDSQLMPGCENHIELKKNGRNIANIQKLLKEKKIIGERP